MKKIVFYFVTIILISSFELSAQEKFTFCTTYCFYDSNRQQNTQFAESLSIHPDSLFFHHLRVGPYTENVEGNWTLLNDTLILSPQKNLTGNIKFTRLKWFFREGKLFSLDSPNTNFHLDSCLPMTEK